MTRFFSLPATPVHQRHQARGSCCCRRRRRDEPRKDFFFSHYWPQVATQRIHFNGFYRINKDNVLEGPYNGHGIPHQLAILEEEKALHPPVFEPMLSWSCALLLWSSHGPHKAFNPDPSHALDEMHFALPIWLAIAWLGPRVQAFHIWYTVLVMH